MAQPSTEKRLSSTEEDEEDDEHGPTNIASSVQSCRMYENLFPDVDDLVMVRVKQIAEMGAYVQLLEYNNIEGMILLSELSRRRIRSISKLIRVGRQEVVVVLRVDKEKGYIDLSKRRVSPEEIAKCEEKYNKSKKVHSIMRHVAETMHTSVEELYVKFGWPLYKKYGHAYDAFKRALNDPQAIFEGYDMKPDLKDAFLKNIKQKMSPQPLKLRADVEVTCFREEGIDAVQAALRAGEQVGSTEAPVKIKLVAPPLYVIVTQAPEKDIGLQLLTQGIEAIRQSIHAKKGELVVKVAPRAVSERDDRELNAMMEEAAAQNAEVSGDEAEEDDNTKSEQEDDEDDDDEEDDEVAAAKDKAAKKKGTPAAASNSK